MADYKLTNTNVVIKNGNTSIPMTETNRDYRKYLVWLALGNTPDPADPEPEPDNQPTMEQEIDALKTENANIRAAILDLALGF
jgi:hypothetical protein